MDASYRVYVGAYTSGDSDAKGIGLAAADPTGALRIIGQAAVTADPSFLAFSPDGRFLYAVNEQTHGRVTAFAVEPGGTLRELNSQPSMGEAPCHLSVHPGGRHLLTANYMSGNLVVHPIAEDGSLDEPTHVVQHSGSGPESDRQQGPHAHMVVPDPQGRYVLAVDLGADSLHVYDFDTGAGRMSPRHEIGLVPGSGPRHLAFHPSGRRIYLISELASTMTELDYDPGDGSVAVGRTLSTLPEGFTGRNLSSEVLVSADGRFVYGSNRGHDSVAVFAADGDGLRLLGIHPAGVRGPRHMQFSPAGDVLFVAGEDSGTVQAFAVEEGSLRPAGDAVSVPSPACVLPEPFAGK